MAKLIFTGEKFGGRVYEIVTQRTTVGRGDANTLSIRDRSVSVQHCEIYDNGEDLIVRDLGSRNGTTINGKLLRAAQGPLAHGEIVKFGAIEARLEITRHATTSNTATDITAIHHHVKQLTPPPPTPNPFATLDAGTMTAPTDQTSLLIHPGAIIPPPPKRPILPAQ